jgi:hypothetical protein
MVLHTYPDLGRVCNAAHPAFPLFEVYPEPELHADIIGIEVIFPIGEDVAG